MKWIYNIQNDKVWREDGTTGIQAILLRPVWEEYGKTYTSGIVDLQLTAIEYINNLLSEGVFNEDETEFLYEIIEKTGGKEYHIDELELTEDSKEIYLNRAEIYIQKSFDLQNLLHWVKIYFTVKGYPCNEFEETDFGSFAFDANPFLRALSDGVKRFEDKLGSEWWKKKCES